MPGSVRIAIVYFSATGHTHQMAEAIADGANKCPDTRADLLRITGKQITDGRWKDEAIITTLDEADAMIFGSPTYMGGAAAQFKAFADWSGEIWIRQGWKDKLAGGFTHASGLSGDKLATLIYFSILAGQHGMNWINPADVDFSTAGTDAETNRMGSYIGVMGQTPFDMERTEPELHPGDRESSARFGRRMADWARRVQSTAKE